MAKRTALNYNTSELTATLRQSSGQGVDALFSQPAPAPAADTKEKAEPVPPSSPPEMEQGQPPSSPAAVQTQSATDQKELESHTERILTSKHESIQEKTETSFQESEDWEREDPESAPPSPLPEKEQQQPPSTPAAIQEQSPADQTDLASNTERILTSKKVSMPESKEASFQESEVWERADQILETLAAPAQINHSFRYSRAELNFIRDVVYEAEVKYKFKLGKGEVLRIALLWLMYDYQASKQDSFLVRLLTRKKTRK